VLIKLPLSGNRPKYCIKLTSAHCMVPRWRTATGASRKSRRAGSSVTPVKLPTRRFLFGRDNLAANFGHVLPGLLAPWHTSK
jgi:hypothetical protein